MQNFFAHQAIDGSWHTVFRSPGCDSLNSVGQCSSEADARVEAERLNREQDAEATA